MVFAAAVVPGEDQVGYKEKISSLKAKRHWQGVEESPSLELFKNCGDMALRNMVMSMVEMGSV